MYKTRPSRAQSRSTVPFVLILSFVVFAPHSPVHSHWPCIVCACHALETQSTKVCGNKGGRRATGDELGRRMFSLRGTAGHMMGSPETFTLTDYITATVASSHRAHYSYLWVLASSFSSHLVVHDWFLLIITPSWRASPKRGHLILWNNLIIFCLPV